MPGTVTVRILGDSKSAEKAFKDVGDAAERTEGRVSKFGGVAKNLAAGAFAGLGAGAVVVGKQMYELGVSLESMEAKANTVFGAGAIGMVKDWAAENANAMGVTRRQAVGLAANFADLLVPMGMTQRQAAKMSTEVVGLSGALSAWSNGQRSAAEVADILQSAMLGETDALKGLGINIGAADVAARLAADGQGELEGKARQAAEAVAIQKMIFEQSQAAQDAFSDKTKTAAESNAELRAKVDELKEAVAVRLQPAVQALVVYMTEEAIPAIGRWAADFERGIDRIVIKYDELSKRGILKWLTDAKDKTRELLGDPLNKDAPATPPAASDTAGGGDFTAANPAGGSRATKRVGVFHSGGLVPGRPGQEVLAVLEAGEHVTARGHVPPDMLTATAAPTFTVVQHIYNGMDQREAENWMRETIATSFSAPVRLTGTRRRAY
jgi:hypothetical protein